MWPRQPRLDSWCGHCSTKVIELLPWPCVRDMLAASSRVGVQPGARAANAGMHLGNLFRMGANPGARGMPQWWQQRWQCQTMWQKAPSLPPDGCTSGVCCAQERAPPQTLVAIPCGAYFLVALVRSAPSFMQLVMSVRALCATRGDASYDTQHCTSLVAKAHDGWLLSFVWPALRRRDPHRRQNGGLARVGGGRMRARGWL